VVTREKPIQISVPKRTLLYLGGAQIILSPMFHVAFPRAYCQFCIAARNINGVSTLQPVRNSTALCLESER